MKANHSRCCLAATAALVFFAILTGCVSQRIVWSPDGRFAAVLGEKGLYLSDATGRISELLAPEIACVAWFPDSRKLALVRERRLVAWTEVQPYVAPEVRQRLEQASQTAIRELAAGQDLTQALLATRVSDGREKSLLCLYLKGLKEVQTRVGPNAQFLESTEVNLAEISVVTVTDFKLTLGPTLFAGLGHVPELRISSNGAVIAFTTNPADPSVDHVYTLNIVAADGSRHSEVVADRCAAYPDWTPDGRSLVFIKPADLSGGSEVIHLASVVRCQVLDEAGKYKVQEKPDELAGLIYDENGRIRCLSDGRIIFAATEVRLPATTADMPQRQQLYALDPERQSTLTPLIPNGVQGDVPQILGFFEPSPDGRRVSVMGDKGQVVILNLAAGTVDTLQASVDKSASSLPSWRSSRELCFIATPTNLASSQVALWNGEKIRTLSEAWGTDIRKGLLDK